MTRGRVFFKLRWNQWPQTRQSRVAPRLLTRLATCTQLASQPTTTALRNPFETKMSEVVQCKKRKTSPCDGEEDASLEPVSNLLVKRHSPKAKLPARGSLLAAGYDLHRYATPWYSCILIRAQCELVRNVKPSPRMVKH